MNENKPTLSPWVQELNQQREILQLTKNFKSDIAIIGGGISGFATAFFLLRFTNKSVSLIEAGKIGHGATGHNAGQVVDYFEKPFTEIASEYGLELASNGQKAISSAWDLLEFILNETKIQINFSKFIGYAGCTNLHQLNEHLGNKLLKSKGGIKIHKVRVSEEFKHLDKIPDEYINLYETVPQSKINDLLETDNSRYIAVLQSQKGCLNSALFVEKLSKYLINKYSDRFNLFEQSPVSRLNLYDNYAILHIREHELRSKRVVLCTNGFENITIANNAGGNINRSYHDMVYSRVGYMTGYLEEKVRDPIAISYLPQKNTITDEDIPYFYLTRRNHTFNNQAKSLVCIGGPETIQTDDKFKYDNKSEYPDEVKLSNKKFLNKSFKHTPQNLQDFHFKWHGLMGYTESGIRCVGIEPINHVLLYNLGCNGVGILPAIYGSSKITDHINNLEVPESIFDPYVQRRAMPSNVIKKNIKKFANLTRP